uniref:Uncharacterized protein n=1 Tax=Aegilops tauschii subsp. strangulata TaxID=200361 RepID=A0A453IZ78_AEGTS
MAVLLCFLNGRLTQFFVANVTQPVEESMLEESTEMDEGFLMSEFKELWDDDVPLPGYF